MSQEIRESQEGMIPLTLEQRLRLFWYAPEYSEARRFACDPEEYHYDDIDEDQLDRAGIIKYVGEPIGEPQDDCDKPAVDVMNAGSLQQALNGYCNLQAELEKRL